MTEIVASLRKFEFPFCVKRALQQLDTYCPADGTTIPGLGEDITEQIVQHFVFCQGPIGKSRHQKKLSAIQELQVIEILIQHFQDQPEEQLCRGVFKLLFSHNLTPSCKDFLSRLISMAVSVQSSKILNSAAAWMQAHGCNSEAVGLVAQCLVRDYDQLVPGSIQALQCLPQLSAHFTCNFITALTNFYETPGSKTSKPTVPTEVLKLVTKWIRDDPRLCLVSLQDPGTAYLSRSTLWTSPTKPNTQTPIPGLLRWSTKAPILARKCGSDSKLSKDLDQEDLSLIWSELHLGILQSILTFTMLAGAAQLEVITLADMRRIILDVKRLVHSVGGLETECAQTATDRVTQVLQVSLATGGFRCSLGDLRSIFQEIPANRLLTVLEKQHLSVAPPQMHNVP